MLSSDDFFFVVRTLPMRLFLSPILKCRMPYCSLQVRVVRQSSPPSSFCVTETWAHWATTPRGPMPRPLATTALWYSASRSLTVLHTSCKWNRAVFMLLLVACFTYAQIFKVHLHPTAKLLHSKENNQQRWKAACRMGKTHLQTICRIRG